MMVNTEIEIPTVPHMASIAIERLSSILKESQCFLEYGAGGSTRLAASIGVPNIYTVESDASFLDAVKSAVSSSGSRSRLHAYLADIGPTKEWGHPINNDGVRSWPNYSLEIWNIIKRNSMMPDIVLVDGRFRVACSLATIINAHPGTKLWLDDYVGREERYQIVTRYARLKDIFGSGALFETMPIQNWPAISVDLARHSVILE